MKKNHQSIHKIMAASIYAISCLIPKSKNLWIFGAWRGQLYADNSKYLFEYVAENKKIFVLYGSVKMKRL